MPRGLYKRTEDTKRKISKGMKGKKNALGKHWFMSEKNREKIRQRQIGKKLSEEIKRKMSLSQIERYKDKKEREKTRLAMKGRKFSEEHRRNISIARKGKYYPGTGFQKGHKPYKTFKENPKHHKHDNYTWHPISTRHFDIHKLSEYREKIRKTVKKLWEDSEYREKHLGSKNPNWKGGLTEREETLAHRLRVELKNWAKEILERDNYTCQKCGLMTKAQGVMEVHHIKAISRHPSLVLDISNGIALCKYCHHKTESYGKKLRKPQ